MSSTGVPSMASRPRTSITPPGRPPSARRPCVPIRLGRFFARWARIPTFGQSVLPRGWRASCSTRQVDAIEHEHHLDVREADEARRRRLAEHREIELHRAVDAVPVVIDGFGACCERIRSVSSRTSCRQSSARTRPARQTLPRAQAAVTGRVSCCRSAVAHSSHPQVRATSAHAISSSSSISAMATIASRSPLISLASTIVTKRMSRNRSSRVSRRSRADGDAAQVEQYVDVLALGDEQLIGVGGQRHVSDHSDLLELLCGVSTLAFVSWCCRVRGRRYGNRRLRSSGQRRDHTRHPPGGSCDRSLRASGPPLG